MDATGRLSEVAIARTVTVLEGYRQRLDELGVARVRAVATSAARDAANPEEFFAAAEKTIGVRPELLSGDEEGRLSFAGATGHLPAGFFRGEPVLVVDIGGGSTELVVGRPSDLESTHQVSLDIGCVRVTERFFRHDPPETGELLDARSDVTSLLESARQRLPNLPPGGAMVGLAGTVSTLAALEHSVVIYDRDQIHHAVLERAAVDMWLTRLASENGAQRLARSTLMAGREDVIVAGAADLVVGDGGLRLHELPRVGGGHPRRSRRLPAVIRIVSSKTLNDERFGVGAIAPHQRRPNPGPLGAGNFVLTCPSPTFPCGHRGATRSGGAQRGPGPFRARPPSRPSRRRRRLRRSRDLITGHLYGEQTSVWRIGSASATSLTPSRRLAIAQAAPERTDQRHYRLGRGARTTLWQQPTPYQWVAIGDDGSAAVTDRGSDWSRILATSKNLVPSGSMKRVTVTH